MPDYIPGPDPEFNSWGGNFTNYVAANFAALGLTQAQATALSAAYSDNWGNTYMDHTAAQAAAAAATATKDASRVVLEGLIRQLAAGIQANPNVTDAQRQGLGLPVHSTSRTPVGPIGSRPVIQVDISQRLQHTLKVTDEATPNSRRKPDGAIGFELWCKKGGPPPAGMNDCSFMGMFTGGMALEQFGAGDGGQVMYYIVRWSNTKGEAGPISDTVLSPSHRHRRRIVLPRSRTICVRA